MMSDLNYHHLRYFRAVAHDGNLTRTAERLNLSQSALSIQIRQLEERLGHALFERRGRQLYLTEAGRIALDRADTIFAAGEELVETLKETGRNRRAIRIGALATLSRNFQIEFLRPILGRADVDMILRSGSTAELLRALETLNLDIVLLNQPPMADSVTPFIAQHVYQQRIGLIGKPPTGNRVQAWRICWKHIPSSCRRWKAASAHSSKRLLRGLVSRRKSPPKWTTWQ